MRLEQAGFFFEGNVMRYIVNQTAQTLLTLVLLVPASPRP